MEKIIISPPISNLVKIKGTSRIVGSYTLNRRPGLWRNLTTLRKTSRGWYNRVGLRNPGIDKFNKSGIVSIAGLEEYAFEEMLYALSGNPNVEGIEFNVSCPNALVSQVNDNILTMARSMFGVVIIKVPHLLNRLEILKLVDNVNCILHISNTKPTSRGALSGSSLVDTNLRSISYIKKERPDIEVIGGGGIYDIQTLKQYAAVGADYFSLSTVLFNPYKTYKIIKSFYEESN